MRIDVYNREQAQGLTPQSSTAVISISHPGQPANLKEGWGGVLRLEFDDALRPMRGAPELVLFNMSHAEEIYAFMADHADQDFLVHCDAGQSRSVAVGIFLAECLEGELYLNATMKTTDGANSRVLRGLRRKLWLEHFEKG